ncbi:unnamed protein product [Oppiella nova]|uniref:Uncharacterized protein n=1 Tax=Oppiella nova TaxID=334625 RepID=A0A7R9MLK7_9ACAR|nr:unnamed protein product [Oppiella nova]CAG2179454.1 unnamed protein product [Oppiella nova]
MVTEANRLTTYKGWPITAGNCTKEKMSSCGFYQCNDDSGDDCVRCFCCFKELDGWQESDDPWDEHKRNNNCYFANLGKPEATLTVREWLIVMEERQVNYVNKVYQHINDLEQKDLKDLGLDKE